jgi:hypothetical protein
MEIYLREKTHVVQAGNFYLNFSVKIYSTKYTMSFIWPIFEDFIQDANFIAYLRVWKNVVTILNIWFH